MDVNEELKFIQKNLGGGGGAEVGSVGGWLGSQGGCERRIKFFSENLKKKIWGGGGGSGRG